MLNYGVHLIGKRSNFERVERDFYPTPKEAVTPLRSVLQAVWFCEPCAGDGSLVKHLESSIPGAVCILATDIEPQQDWILSVDANTLTGEQLLNCDMVITNPPFSWHMLEPLLTRWIDLLPTLVLLPADFMHNRRSQKFMRNCKWILPIGRVKWIADSTMSGKENYCWYLFDKTSDRQTLFLERL